MLSCSVEHTRFFKKTAGRELVCEIVKLSGFERPQKTKIITELNADLLQM